MFGSEYWIYYFPKYWQQNIKVSLWCINIFWLFYLRIEWMQLQRSLHWGLWRKIMQLINWHIESHLTTSSRDNKCIGLGWTLLLFDLSIFLFSWKKMMGTRSNTQPLVHFSFWMGPHAFSVKWSRRATC